MGVDDGIEASHLLDCIPQLDLLESIYHHPFGNGAARIRVLQDAALEDVGLLGHGHKTPTNVLGWYGGNVDIIHEYRSIVYVCHPEETVYQCTLTAAQRISV